VSFPPLAGHVGYAASRHRQLHMIKSNDAHANRCALRARLRRVPPQRSEFGVRCSVRTRVPCRSELWGFCVANCALERADDLIHSAPLV
jgi:hypothetical protein